MTFSVALVLFVRDRIGYRGQVLIETHDDEGKAITALMKLASVKRKRGYGVPSTTTPLEMPKLMQR